MGVPSRRPEVLHETGNQAPVQSRFATPASASPSGGRLDDLPAPRTSRGGHKLGCLALLALLLVAGAAVWLTRDDATRDTWRKDAVTWLDAKLEGTALAPLMNLLRETPPPPPPSVATPATEPGTLAGPTVQGTVSALVRTDFVSPGAVAPVPAGQEAQKRQYPADSRVQPAFVDDLAGHVLERQRESLDLSLPSLNQRYGVKLTGLAGGSRAAVLRYAFHPDMLRSLYTIYADRFLDSLDRQCTERNWSDLQKRQLHMALAGRLNAWAAALDGVAAVPDLSARLAESERLLQESLDIYGRMAGTVFELDEARQRNDAAAIATAQLRVDDITGRYRQAMDARTAAQHALVGDIRRHAGAALDDDSLLFVAQWVGRRLQQDSKALATVRAGSAALRDMAGRCTRIASGKAAAEQPAAPAVNDVPLRPGPKQARPRPAAAPALPAAAGGSAPVAPAAPVAAPEVAPQGLLRRPCPRRGLPSAGRSRLRPSRPANTCGARVRAHACGPAPGNGRRFGRRSRAARTGPVPLGRRRPARSRKQGNGKGGGRAVWQPSPVIRPCGKDVLSRQAGSGRSSGSFTILTFQGKEGECLRAAPLFHTGQGSLGGPSRSAGMSRF